MKNTSEIISLSKMLASTISSRDAVELLKKHIFQFNAQSIVLDFTNIDFVSRSAAHELLLLKEAMRQHDKEISFENANQDIEQMIRIVAANRAVPKNPKPTFKAEKVSISSLI